jgi:thioredoxin 1
LEFGADWCGFSKAAQPSISDALCRHPEVQHIRVADSPSCRLGRSYRVKLWPTLILLRDGREVERVIRPDRRAVKKLLAAHATRKRDAQQVAAHNVMQKDLETIP